jgi:RimJ/RimL family protein N-acetyltransferase
VRLTPLTAALACAVEPWFTDPEVIRWLGPPRWIHQALAVLSTPVEDELSHGRRVLGAHGWVALDATGAPVGYVGGDVYDRWHHGTVTDDVPSMGLAFVIDPARRRQGWGLALLEAVLAHPELTRVAVFFAGIEPGNTASSALAARAGFLPVDEQPDEEGIVYWRLSRPTA